MAPFLLVAIFNILLVTVVLVAPVALAARLIPRRLEARFWMVVGLALLLGQFAPVALLVDPYLGDTAFKLPIQIGVYALFPAALIAAAFLLLAGLNLLRSRSEREPGPEHWAAGGWAGLSFGLAALLLARALFNFYWLIIWDSTYDALDVLLLLIPAAAGLVAGVMLTLRLRGWWRWAGLYGLAAPALLVGVFGLARQVNFERLTEQHAAQVAQALETYRTRSGQYPLRLRDLTPWTVPVLPGQVTISGLDWCYESDGSYYRLGYVTRGHWSAPDLQARLFREAGALPGESALCQDQFDVIEARFPGFFSREDEWK